MTTTESRLLARMRERQAAVSIPHRTDTSDTALSFAQRRMWFLDQLTPGSAEYVVPCGFQLRGTVDVPALQAAFAAIVARHEVLRTRFVTRKDGEPRQIVDEPWPVEMTTVDLTGKPAEARALVAAEAIRPFDLTSGRLLRVMLVKVAEQEHLLLVSMHHIVTDGWSMEVLGHELKTLYSGETPPELSLQYGDFAAWQSEWLTGPVLERQLGYWRDRLAGLEPLVLPTDRPRPLVRSSAGDGVPFTVPAHAAAVLKELADRHGASLFMVGLAAFMVVMSRWSGQDDLCVGTPVAGRNRAEIEDLIGFFVNTVVIRADVSADPTFEDLIEQIKATALDAYAHQELPFERLVAEIAPDRDLARNPLFQVVFAMESMTGGDWGLPGVTAQPIEVNPMTSKFDLSVFLSEEDSGTLSGNAVFSTELFDATTVERLAGHLVTLVEDIARDPGRRISQYDVLSPAERTQLVGEFNDAVVPYADSVGMHELVEAQVARVPDAVAVRGDRTVTYRELNARANQLAGYLQDHGVGVGSLVGVCLNRGVDMIVTVLAVLKAGAAYVPLDPDYPVQRLEFMIKDTNAPLIITEPALSARFEDVDVPQVLVGDPIIASYEDSDLPPTAGPEDLAYIIYTSGSTGTPKGVMVEHRSICRLVDNNWFADIGPDDVIAQASNFSFDAFTFECWAALTSGASIAVLAKETVLNPDAFEAAVREHGITTLFITSALFNQHLLDRPDVFACLKTVLYGGELIDRAVADSAVTGKWAPGYLGHVYGPTETTTFATCYPVGAGDSGCASMPIGRPISNTELLVMDRHGGPAPVGVPGELWIGGPGVARGYWNRPELTAERFVQHPFTEGRVYRTGDLVRWLPSGNIEFLGRIDQQVKIRGLRIELGEIESVLGAHDTVSSAVVVVREDTPGDKRLVAYCVGGEVAGAELRTWCQRGLPEYMIPSAFMFLDTLPLTPNGKLDKRALPAPTGDAFASDYVAPRSEMETAIAEIWADVLGVERVGVHDDFFTLGGHSLLVTRVINRIASTVGRTVSVRDMFGKPTVAALAANLSTSDETVPLVLRGAVESELSFAQRRLWFFDQLEPGSTEYVVPYAFHVTGDLDVPALEAAFSTIVARHEALRTQFISGPDGQPRQVVGEPWPVKIAMLDDVMAEAERPFDLTSGRLLRVSLAKVAEQEHMLLVSMHHIVTDGWSMEVLGRELRALYSGATLPPLPVQYADFAAWQGEWLDGPVLDRQLAYWRGRLAGLEPLDLPTDRPRPAARSGAGDVVRFTVPAELAGSLRELAGRTGTSLFMVGLAAFLVVLSRWSDQDDVCVGTPIAGRNRAEIEDLIGFFVNTLVMRGDLSANPTFEEFLAQVRDTALEAYAHQDLPFERLVAEIAPDRAPDRNPLFQVAFAVQSVTGEDWTMPGVTVRPVEVDSATSTFDLTIFLSEIDGGELRGNAVFATDLFDSGTIQRLVGHLLTVLSSVVTDATQRVAQVELVSAAERARILGEFNATTVPFADDFAVQDLVQDQAVRRPDALAVSYGSSRLTYQGLNARANQLARRLQTRGVTAGTRVAICLPRGVDLAIAVLGVLKAGAAYVPLDPDYPMQRLEFMLDDSEALLVVTAAGMPELPGPRLLMDEDWPAISMLDDTDLSLDVGPTDLAYVMYTSGSTGTPKGVMIDHRAICRLVDNNIYADIGPQDVLSQGSSFSFDAFTFEYWAALTCGAALVVLPKDTVLSAVDLKAAIKHHGITTVFITSALFNQLTHDCPDVWDGVKTVLYGGELVDRAIADRLIAGPYAPGSVVNAYGPTEATTFATCYEVTDADSGCVSMPIGRPIANTDVYVMDRHGGLAPIGIPGELWIGGPGVAQGYWNRPDLTAQRFVSHPFKTGMVYRTGDLVRWLPSGAIEFLGRIDQQVKLRGLRIELGEIEAAIGTHYAVMSAVVVLREDTPGDKRLVAYCVLTADTSTTELRSWCLQTLPDYMVPSDFIMLDAFPLTQNGKVDRRALPAPATSRTAAGYVPPRTPVEAKIAEIWSEVLGADQVGVHDNFYTLGGHSLRAVTVATRLQKVGVNVTVRHVLRHQTVAALASAVGKSSTSLLFDLSDGPGQTLFCIHPGGGSAHWYRQLAAAVTGTHRLVGVQAAGMEPDEKPCTTIPEMAARYWEEIKAVQPDGPYHLLGWSLGAVVAHEMARLNPGEVAEVHLLEPPLVEPGVRTRLLSYVDQYRRAAELWQHGRTVSEGREEVLAELRKVAEPLEVDEQDVTLEDWVPFETLGLLMEAVVNYVPLSSQANATLVISDTVGQASNHSDGNAQYYVDSWDALYPAAIPVVRLAGDHMDMVTSEEALAQLASELRR